MTSINRWPTRLDDVKVRRDKRSRPVVQSLALLLIVAATGMAANDVDRSTLNWANGDQLAGELVSADATHLQWQAPVFTAPFILDMQQLHSVRFPLKDDLQKTDEPFRIFTHSGDVLNGRILRITRDDVVIQCKRHGRITLKRARIRSFRRLNDPALIFEGPSGVAEWSTISRSRSVDDWHTAAQGGLQTTIVGAELYRDLKLPAVAEIEMTLSWQQKPGFLVTFVEPNARRVPKHTVKLETWDDELVMQALASTGDFEQVETLSTEDKTIQLRLLWDQSNGELTAYSRAGEMLAKLKSDRQEGQNLTCLYIKNKGSDLKVSNIRVRSWNGTALSALAEGRAHIHRLDGSFEYGHIQSYDPEKSADVLLSNQQGSHRIPLDQVSGADLGGSDTKDLTEKFVQVSYTDGTVLGGTLEAIKDGRIRLTTDYADAAIESDLAGAYVLAFRSAPTSPTNATGDVLEYRGARLHGNLAPVGQEGRLGWKPIGSKNASPLLSTDPARVVRQVTAAEAPPADGKREMIYLRNGDIIPCRVLSIGQDRVVLDPAFAQVTSVPRDQVKAISLASDATEAILEFDHPSWLIRAADEKSVKRSAGKATFMDSATMTHMDLLAGDSMQFDVDWTASEPVSVTVALQARNRSGTGWNFKLYFTGDQIHVQGLQSNQGFVYRNRLPERTANIQISLRSNRFQLRINGDMSLNQPIAAGVQPGRGVAFAIKRERPVPGTLRENLITISNLRTGNMRFLSGTIDLPSDTKDQILTIPRSRKKNPPTHLMVAYNGDVLRGRLLSMSEQFVEFRSRFDDLRIPRDRIGMLVWLEQVSDDGDEVKPPEPARQQPLESPMQAVLLGGITFSFSADKMVGNEIVGVHPLLGDCRLPVDRVREVRIGSVASVSRRSLFSEWMLQNAPEPQFVTAPGASGSELEFGMDSPLVGTQAANFQGRLLSGKPFVLNEHTDKIVVLDFWATWCGPCIRAMPDLMSVVSEFPDEKVILVGVNQQENEKTIVDFLKARQWDLTVVLDPDGTISQQFQVQAIPQTVVIGPGGKIERLHIGAHNNLGEELKKVLTELIGGADEAPPANG